ncbi:MAG: hypothetical protein IJ306_10145 [Oscillospiraceae bacterium]|nr:hypothetical protein [Oscillospiraceae bacterium]
MTLILIVSIFDIIYGIFGLFGKIKIPEKFRGYDWTDKYTREVAVSNLLLGIPWLVLYFAFSEYTPPLATAVLFMVLLSLPAIVYSVFTERKYLKLLKK